MPPSLIFFFCPLPSAYRLPPPALSAPAPGRPPHQTSQVQRVLRDARPASQSRCSAGRLSQSSARRPVHLLPSLQPLHSSARLTKVARRFHTPRESRQLVRQLRDWALPKAFWYYHRER